MISGYEMTGDKRLLELADDLGRRMSPMFDSPTGMPYEYVNLHTGADADTKSNPAEIGTLLLNSARWRGYRQAGVLRQGQARVGRTVQAALDDRAGGFGDRCGDGQVDRSDIGIRGGIDSYYEYLLKASILFGDKDCARMWQESVRAIDKYLADDRPNGLWYG